VRKTDQPTQLVPAEHVLAGSIEVMTTVEARELRAARAEAVQQVVDILGRHRPGEDVDSQQVVCIAAWLANGDLDPLLECSRLTHELYQDTGGDAVRYRPGH